MELNLRDFLYHMKENNNDPKLKVIIEFMGHCMKNFKQTNSQNFQDQFALYIKEKAYPSNKGFFVEFGAADAINSSNTYVLEKTYNWDGILVEPNPDYYEELMRHRRVPVLCDAVSKTTGEKVVFIKTYDPALSTIKGYGENDEHSESRKNGKEIEVNTITLHRLLTNMKAPKVIDYISVDTEGSEYDIIEKFFQDNKNEYKINCFTIEHNFQNETRQKIQDLMITNGYMNIFQEFSRWDDFYVLKDIIPEYNDTADEEFVYRT